LKAKYIFRGKDFCFCYIFSTNFSGHKNLARQKIWGRALPPNTPTRLRAYPKVPLDVQGKSAKQLMSLYVHLNERLDRVNCNPAGFSLILIVSSRALLLSAIKSPIAALLSALLFAIAVLA